MYNLIFERPKRCPRCRSEQWNSSSEGREPLQAGVPQSEASLQARADKTQARVPSQKVGTGQCSPAEMQARPIPTLDAVGVESGGKGKISHTVTVAHAPTCTCGICKARKEKP